MPIHPPPPPPPPPPPTVFELPLIRTLLKHTLAFYFCSMYLSSDTDKQ